MVTSPDDDARRVPPPSALLAAFAVLNLGAILIALGLGIRYGIPWAFVTLGVALVVEGAFLLDVSRAARRPASDVAEGPPAQRHQRRPPVFPSGPAPPRQPAAGAVTLPAAEPPQPAGPAGSSAKG